MLERAARALTDANLAVYPVDATGLSSPKGLGARNSFGGGVPYQGEAGLPMQTSSPQQLRWDTMNAIAERTGGRAFYNTNDFSTALRRAVDDSRVVYTLSYAPTHGEWDGKFREIKVECRRAGVKLRHRKGYFALPDRALDATGRQEMLEAAQWSPLVATEIGLTAHVSPGNLDGQAAKVITVTVDAQNLHFDDKDGRHVTDLLLLVAQRAEDGKPLGSKAHDLRMQIKEETFRTVMEYGLRVTVTSVLEPATRRMRLVLLDAATGRLGSLDVPVSVSAPAETKPGES